MVVVVIIVVVVVVVIVVVWELWGPGTVVKSQRRQWERKREKGRGKRMKREEKERGVLEFDFLERRWWWLGGRRVSNTSHDQKFRWWWEGKGKKARRRDFLREEEGGKSGKWGGTEEKAEALSCFEKVRGLFGCFLGEEGE